MPRSYDIVVVGAGIYGACAALELCLRGYGVALVEQGTPPYTLACSTDISKVIHMAYNADEVYTEMAEPTIVGSQQIIDAASGSASR